MTQDRQFLLWLKTQREIKRAGDLQVRAYRHTVLFNAVARKRLFERRDQAVTDAPPSRPRVDNQKQQLRGYVRRRLGLD